MHEVKKIKKLFELKQVLRTACEMGDRPESTAEHTYSVLVLAQHFLPQVSQELDELKVMKMLLAHDIVEIEAGDVFTYDKKAKENQVEREKEAFLKLKEKVPSKIGEDLHSLWLEFEECQTEEAKFCKAIDAIDPLIHNIFSPGNWQKGKITPQMVRDNKGKYFQEFPALQEVFNRCLKYAEDEEHYKGE